MWKKQGPDASGGKFGVGVQVIVRLDRAQFPDSLADDPIGVIVAPGALTGSSFYVPTTVRETVWLVAFEEPFYGLDGSGPHESAKVPESRLQTTPEV
ncbi:hypothetical protein [Cryobacterium psychrophilum]|uniref:Uncharacterized protein n=1 Tax=Cryobacterium psychrophilum TaxID=41988 RepID=A0A4Y8KPV5_9MICO|nr:hypothetical protein [Cryobacterium psychrophilum]TDW31265.1 hypothetical protein EDD25_3068 [Cryobacterium psychrophilum]TFD78446.1 hypothetical protein E3T53_09640 [Cryobacterium psychrophilum]